MPQDPEWYERRISELESEVHELTLENTRLRELVTELGGDPTSAPSDTPGVAVMGSSGGDLNPLVEIPSGDFMMGALERDEEADDDEKPRHRVEISGSFLMGKYAVTQALYESVMGVNPSWFKGSFRPVEQVSWFDAVSFCNRLSSNEGLEEVYSIDGEEVSIDLSRNGYRLPTEAEWEYAARGGEEHLYSGSDNLDEVGWYDENSGTGVFDEDGDEILSTHPVGEKKANGFGLHDMTGNVWEWCSDDWGEEYSSRTAKVTSDPHPTDTGAPNRVLRGGSWYNDAWDCRVSYRFWSSPSLRDRYLGFRILRTK